jgi:hypothetical protein
MTQLHSRKENRRRPSDGKQRFYLLPGQGGSGYRRKQRVILQTSIFVGILVSLLLAAIMYLIYRLPR